MREVAWFEVYTLWFLVPIGIFVGGLLGYVIWKYNAVRHPVASRTSHNTTIEVVWTIAPVLILLFLAVPSFQLLSAQFDPPEDPAFTVKTTGYQWYWNYEYQNDEDGEALLAFDSHARCCRTTTATRSARRDLSTSTPIFSPSTTSSSCPRTPSCACLVTAGDVIHSWAMPSFGKKMDAIPGRLNETWFKVNEPGLYYGQCSELCGKDHAFMPIAVRVVTRPQFDRCGTRTPDQRLSLNEANSATDRRRLRASRPPSRPRRSTADRRSGRRDETPGGERRHARRAGRDGRSDPRPRGRSRRLPDGAPRPDHRLRAPTSIGPAARSTLMTCPTGRPSRM